MKNIRRQVVIAAALLAAAQMSGSALAQAYPSKPITIVVAYPAGGDTDAIARLLAEKLSLRLKQPIVVDNRPGASGTIGNAYVGKSAPDGYTLLLTPGTFSTAPAVLGKGAARYDVLNGFTPIIQTGSVPLFLVTSEQTAWRSVPDVVAAAKATSLTYGSPGNGSPMHFMGEMLNKAAGISILHVPYKGVAPIVTDVLGGHLPLAWLPFGSVEPYLASGKLRALAVAQATRSSLAPNVP